MTETTKKTPTRKKTSETITDHISRNEKQLQTIHFRTFSSRLTINTVRIIIRNASTKNISIKTTEEEDSLEPGQSLIELI